MSEPLIIAVASKGRPKEQVEAWLADCGLDLQLVGGSRGYIASLKGMPGVQVRLLSASDIADALDAGEVHLGITGEDLLRERGQDIDQRLLMLRALGFGRADLVVAVPKSWLDVDTMADLEEVAHEFLARTGRRMRVATKYVVQTRAYFARHGVSDYRITESGGATEGAPASGGAELIVDITTTGATLNANGLKVLADGLILKSQFQLAANLQIAWSDRQLDAAQRLLRIVEARSAALRTVTLDWPQGDAPSDVIDTLVAQGATRRSNGLLVGVDRIPAVAGALTAVGLGPVTVARPDFVFDLRCAPFEQLIARLKDDTGVKK
ncbi:MAG: ATP phosphoribosyltransferase [Phenylobacterium sp.]|uniref:ATP phosphoribosyltransferase n=1 Tax=Phenylobacterium sp. TaxID=1871053 RepID=UPI002737310C|nr:ATP phosphoribosyltransferase [Phenylobacterium sp.]MDP3175292.1 ATP phosphoribosyltransferase [Phenylobacterium sp.]